MKYNFSKKSLIAKIDYNDYVNDDDAIRDFLDNMNFVENYRK